MTNSPKPKPYMLMMLWAAIIFGYVGYRIGVLQERKHADHSERREAELTATVKQLTETIEQQKREIRLRSDQKYVDSLAYARINAELQVYKRCCLGK